MLPWKGVVGPKAFFMTLPITPTVETNFLSAVEPFVDWERIPFPCNKFVISTEPQRSGEICGFFWVLMHYSRALIALAGYGTGEYAVVP